MKVFLPAFDIDVLRFRNASVPGLFRGLTLSLSLCVATAFRSKLGNDARPPELIFNLLIVLVLSVAGAVESPVVCVRLCPGLFALLLSATGVVDVDGRADFYPPADSGLSLAAFLLSVGGLGLMSLLLLVNRLFRAASYYLAFDSELTWPAPASDLLF